MAQQTVGIGSAPNDGTGDDLRTAGGKINDNFTELYDALPTGDVMGTSDTQTATNKTINSGDNTLQTADDVREIPFSTVAAMLADTDFGYAESGTKLVAEGDIFTAGGFRYTVAASGATDHHVTTAGGVKLIVLPGADGYLHLPAFLVSSASQLINAIQSADGVGLDWGSEQVEIDAAVTVTVSVLRWRSSGATVTYTGATDISSFISLTVDDDEDHEVIGELTVDGASKSGTVFSIIQPLGGATATLRLDKVTSKNARLVVGASASANCVKVQGGFSLVDLIDVTATKATIEDGAGVGGTRGVQGILVGPVSGTSGAYPLRTRIIQPIVSDVYAEDVDYQYDMDGISHQILMTDTTNGEASVEVITPIFDKVWGREVKTQCFFSHVDRPKITSTSGPTDGRLFPMIDFQSGPGVVTGGDYQIDGVEFDEVASIVRFSLSEESGACSSQWNGGNVRLTGGAVLPNVVMMDPEDNVKMAVRAAGQTVSGETRNFGYVKTNGLDLHHMVIDGVVCELTDALARTESRGGGSSPYRSRVWAKNVLNIGSDVPLSRQSVSGLAAWAIASADQCEGFEVSSLYNASGATSPAGRMDTVVFPEYMSSDNFGYMQGKRYLAYSLANNAEVTLPEWGASGSCLITIKLGAADRNGYAEISTDSGGIVERSVGSSFNVGAATDPGSGSYRIWRDGTQIVLKNAGGATRYFTVEMSG